MSALDTNWQIITNVATVNDVRLVHLPLTVALTEDAGRIGTDEVLACNAVASVIDYEGSVISTLANEIRCVGARRVDNANTTDYGAGALGIEYFNTDGSGDALGIDPFGDEYAQAVKNITTYSEDVSNWSVASGGTTVTSDDATAPDGTTTADLTVQIDSTLDGNTSPVQALVLSAVHTASVYCKKDDSGQSKISVYDFDLDADPHWITFNWDGSGVPTTNGNNGASSITYESIGLDWYRVSFEFTTPASGGTFGLTVKPNSATTDTLGIWQWGAQINRGSIKQYVPTTTAPAYAAPLAGQLIEEASTNLFVSPTSAATQNITTTAQDYTVSITGTGDITLTGTATGTATEGNPLTVTATAGTLTCTVNGTVDIGQVEAKSYPTSFMLDATTRPLTDAQAAFPTTITTDFKVDFDFSGMVDDGLTSVVRLLFFISNDNDNYVGCYVNPGSKFLSLVKRVGGTSYTSATTAELDLSVQHSVSCDISSSTGVTLTVDGVAATADANTTDPVLIDKTVYICHRYDQTDFANCSIKNLTIYKDTSADPYTTRLTLAGAGTGLVGARVSVTGVGGSTAYEDKQFTPVAFDDNNIDVDWSQFALSAPADTWTVGGMARLYQVPAACSGAMKSLFNGHEVTALTSTGSTAAEFEKDNVLNSNRALVHRFAAGGSPTDFSMVATISASDDKLVTAVALLDYVGGGADDLIRIEGEGETYPVDVVYPATVERYAADESLPTGYPQELTVPHFIAYIPPMLTGTVTVGMLDVPANQTAEFSELMLCVAWTPVAAKNFNFDSKTKANIDSTDVWRGRYLHRERKGLTKARSVTLEMISETDCVYADLMMNAPGTILFDSYPLEDSKRHRTMIAGYLVGDINVDQLKTGGLWPIQIIDSKKAEGLT